jgi:hypothetical protein
MKMKKAGTTAKISLLMVLAIALTGSAYAELPKLQPATQANKPVVSGMAANPLAYSIAKCERTLNMDISFTPAWLASHVSAPHANMVNINKLQLNLNGSSNTEIPGNVACHYVSPGGDINNLVYKFPCKNAKPQGAPDTYLCKK